VGGVGRATQELAEARAATAAAEAAAEAAKADGNAQVARVVEALYFAQVPYSPVLCFPAFRLCRFPPRPQPPGHKGVKPSCWLQASVNHSARVSAPVLDHACRPAMALPMEQSPEPTKR
jgi:hypothetical protein